MADKILNPSPKIPEGEKPALSPNPKYEDGLKEGARGVGQPTNPNNPAQVELRTNFTKPEIEEIARGVSEGLPSTSGATAGQVLKLDNDKNPQWANDTDTKGFEVLELSNLSGTLTDEQYNLALSDACVIKLGTQYFYKEFNASTLLTYKAFGNNVSTGTITNDYVEITKADKSWELKNGYAIKVNPTLDGTESEIEGLQVGDKKYKAKSGGGGGSIDSDVEVEIESDYTSNDYANRTNYADPITLQEFIANCENGVYTNAGIIARVKNLLSETTFRIILIGVNQDVLAYNDTEVAKTTWQFLDMPEHNVRLGLPFNVLDWVQGSGRSYLKEYLDGTNTADMQLYPSNMDGLISAQGLLQVCHTVFEELPDTLKRHIKTVRRYYYRKRNYMGVGANGGTETNNPQMCQLASNVFHLSRYDLFGSGETEGSGSKYPYFAANANRVRFYNGSATSWWNASPRTSSSSYWYTVTSDGNSYNDGTYGAYGVAPAFCI